MLFYSICLRAIFQVTYSLFNPHKSKKMPTSTIRLRLDSTGRLSDPGTLNVQRRYDVDWEIGSGQDIESFRIEAKNPGDTYPFQDPLPSTPVTSLIRKVRSGASYRDWNYSIIYKISSTQQEYTCDPKIAVKPGTIAIDFRIVLAVAAVVLVATLLLLELRDDEKLMAKTGD
jgi:hypothetical protein